ncbi:putative potassium transporter 4 [Hibiscus syriacus]|uniref:Potassium transporter n=1 Tax=Hibiscus syriacus TaxID=106335 RepID=A0A6A2WZC9_HIBSY|nr:probable potassium transporter 17 isoform X1 [Hibiscus syriacus]XP_039041039.1 probable potassium transporter 17 isoform X1 [Hibiscus syriacus]XP_039041040.1 probable potassium transporter 17 isoform X2 [Hibiscus syriacus]KAE8667268.1 putative potassium transporter 4 [Hibiscus syriacus]
MDTQSAPPAAAALSELVIDSASTTSHYSDSLHFPHDNTTDTQVLRSSDKKESSKWNTLFLAYKTLGVVFGGLVTSPLYVYPSMHLNSPTEEDYLGIYSIMFWTLTLIGVVKYTCIALKADDQGEGGTFALYSLLCRHMNIGILPSKRSDLNSSPSRFVLMRTTTTGKVSKVFERSMVARRALLFIAMLGTCMLIGDGILTPAISVLSAMDGLRAPFPSVSKSLVEALSAVVLFVLFLLQKFGTSRVSFLFSPIMGAWTLSTPLVGIYSIIHHYPGIFKALSPHYIFHFFRRNGKEGWLMLGGTILCITGSEALFADLGHFNRSSIQIAFLFTIYPSLILTYAGQTAYLIRNPDDHIDGFYKFIPKTIYWPIFIIATSAAVVASQSLISATFSVIKQSVVLDYFPRVKVVHTSSNKEGEVYSPEVNYILMILCVAVILVFGDGQEIGNAFGVVVSLVMLITTILLTLVMIIIWRTPLLLVAMYFVVFFTMEGVYVSAVLTKIPEGGWIPFAISIILAFIMFGWYYGRQRKVEYELTHKIDLGRLGVLLSDPSVQRVPGLCFFYSNIQNGLTPILGHYIKNTRSLHKVTIFTTLRYLLVPKVAPQERIVVKKLGLRGVYACVIQYGYADSVNLGGDDFVSRVMDSLRVHIENSSGCLPSVLTQGREEISELREVEIAGVIHVRGKARFHVGKNTSLFDRLMLAFYEVLHNNCRSALPALGVPLPQRLEVGMLYEA